MSRFREPVRSATSGILIFLLASVVICVEGPFASGRIFRNLTVGDSLSATTHDVLLSENGRFAVGFFPDVQNALDSTSDSWFTGDFLPFY